jgi:hypothetical protein
MTEPSGSDGTRRITVQLPCKLAERVEKYALEQGGTITSIMIEVLDTFLRNQKE